MPGFRYHVFLSYATNDKPLVEELARRLERENVQPWLDNWNLIPGEPWQPAIEQALADSATCAVIIGRGDLGPWQNEEMQVAIARRVDDRERRFRVIPVLLPGVERPQRSKLPSFLVATTWVEFRDTIDDPVVFHRLICGIRGIEPGAGPGGTSFAGQCPYRGLEQFDVQHSPLFFGREALTEWLLDALKRKPSGAENRFLAILGASGSGKSSLARAGLLAALKEGKLDGSAAWPRAVCRPGAELFFSLATALTAISPQSVAAVVFDRLQGRKDGERSLHVAAGLVLGEPPRAERLVVLVDQFEEIFTLCTGEAERRMFISNLLHAALVAGGRTIVVLTMRADFYHRCGAHDDLAAALSDHQVLVGPMTKEELRRAIECPARLAGLEPEPGLIELLLDNVQDQPGALPLLQFALRELWERREAHQLTVQGYRSMGELSGALQRRADAVYAAFSDEEKWFCRRIFLRLTRPGEGTEDTKRRASFDELIASEAEQATVEEVVHKLADARLITTEGRETPAAAGVQPRETEACESPAPPPGERQPPRYVEVAHEALIRGWKQLREWIDADRVGLRLRGRLTEDAREWKKHPRDVSLLYQGTPLAVAQKWVECHRDELTSPEREFLDASLVEVIRVAETKNVLPLVKQLAGRGLWGAKELFYQIIKKSDGDCKECLHASLALLPEDEGQVDYLFHRLLEASPTELPVIRDALGPYQERLVERLWRVLEQPEDEGRCLQAASALALYDRSIPRWKNVGGKVAQALVKVNVVFLGSWLVALRPAQGELTAPLAAIFRDKKQSETERSLAMNILADYASDQPTLLADLLMDAEENQFADLFDKLKTHQDLAVPVLEAELARKPAPDATADAQDQLAQRQARAAVALVSLGQGEKVWTLLRYSPDPSVRSYIVNWLKPLGAEPKALMTKLEGLAHDPVSIPKDGKSRMDAILFHPETSMRRALILALGTYGTEELSPGEREPLTGKLLDLYSNDPDSGIHGATEWTLRQWKQQEKIKERDAELMKVKDRGNHSWYVNSEGQTFVVIEGPVEFSMGSPHSEPDGRDSENLHRKRINRRFAVATKEVTVEQYQRFLKENPKIARLEIDRYSPEPTGPMNGTTWYEAAAYCNWLSQQEGLATCYEPNDEGEYAEGMKIRADALQRTGYRLPTEAEWEYACRAGAVTSRYYGRSVELLGKYAWYLQNSQERAWPCGQLLPNELGLFDMLGNVYEWCHEQYYRYPEGEGNTKTDDMNILLSIN